MTTVLRGNVGAAIPKKNMGDFVALSRLLPEREFNLYALGYRSQDLEELNRTLAGRVNFVPPVDPEDMAPEYKKHAWLVYTASPEKATVGWPMALIEAMASGVGACMQEDRVHPMLGVGKELSIQFVLGYQPLEFGAALNAIAEGQVDLEPLLTGSVGIDGVPQAFADLGNPEQHAKILVEP